MRLLPLALCLVCLLAACAVPSAEGSALTVTCFEAGKADAFLFVTEEGTVLVDCGLKGFGETILETLEAQGIDTIDVLILTHFDKDHIGGAAAVLEGVAVGTVYQSNAPKDSSAYAAYCAALEAAGLTPITLRAATSFTLGGVTFTLDAPDQESYTESPSNNASLILSVEHGANRLLFTGDAESARLEEFLRRNHYTYTLLKLPHHGAWDSQTDDLIASTKPQYALITSSKEEPEDEQTLNALTTAQAEIFLTRNGTVVIESDGKALTVRQERG